MTEQQRMTLALKTKLSLSTVTRWDQGKTVNDSTDHLLLRTAVELGFAKANEDHDTDKAAS